MKFDSNLAWQRASSAVAANREVVLALAGVFFLLPTLGLTLLVPPPQPSPGAGTEAVMKSFNEYYSAAFPYLLPIAVLQAMGMLALLTLLTESRYMKIIFQKDQNKKLHLILIMAVE